MGNPREHIEETVRDLESEVRVINAKVETVNDKIDDMKEVVQKQTQLLEKFVIWQERQTYLTSRVNELEDSFKQRKKETQPLIDEAQSTITKVKFLLAIIVFVSTLGSGYVTWKLQYSTEKTENLYTDMVVQKTTMENVVRRVDKIEHKVEQTPVSSGPAVVVQPPAVNQP